MSCSRSRRVGADPTSMEVKNDTKAFTHLRYPLLAAVCRHERLCTDAVGGLQLRLSNGQRAVRDRRSDENAMGFAVHPLYLACDRLRMGRLGVG